MTQIRIIDGATVRALLPYDECIRVVRDAMIEVSRGHAHLPLRQAMKLPTGTGILGQMPGYLAHPECFGIKLVSLFPGNPGRGLSSHLGAYILFEATTGEPRALLNAAELTAIRTAAASAVATLALMRPASCRLAILGTGEQARAHVAAMLQAHSFESVVLWGRSADRAQRLAASLDGVSCSVAVSAEQAVRDADVICTVTSSKTPIVRGDWLQAGQHVNLVGASFADAREIDDNGVVRSRYFVDHRLSAMAQAGELLSAIASARVGESHVVAEIGEVLDGRVAGRRTPDEVTLYKSLGIAAQDLAAAMHVVAAAARGRVGTVARI